MRPFSESDLLFIVLAVRWTVLLSIVAFIGGGIGGLLVALARTGEFRWLRWLSIAYIKLFQGTPLLDAAVSSPSSSRASSVSTSIRGAPRRWGSPCMQALFWVRSGAAASMSCRSGQSEAARALGLSYLPRMALVVIPQAVRIAIPPTIGFLVQLIKGTSLASIIGFVEITRGGADHQQRDLPALHHLRARGARLLHHLLAALALLSRAMEKRLAAATVKGYGDANHKKYGGSPMTISAHPPEDVSPRSPPLLLPPRCCPLQRRPMAATPAEIKTRGKLMVGILTDYPPFGGTDANQKPAGYTMSTSQR